MNPFAVDPVAIAPGTDLTAKGTRSGSSGRATGLAIAQCQLPVLLIQSYAISTLAMRDFEDPLKNPDQLRALATVRGKLLAYLPWFVQNAAKLHGVQRIALLGSITTDKRDPKDIDFLVTVTDEAELEPLARLGRKLKGRTQQFGHGADIFLVNPQGKYIGRTCQWQECRPGIRLSCDALNCGRRSYLHDDLKAITLSAETMHAAIELWPHAERREGLPSDLETVVRSLE